jgi:anthranilate/para-aminobenzoate synthase component I
MLELLVALIFAEDEMDTCIAIRTMVFKNGVVYLQAGEVLYSTVTKKKNMLKL